MPEPIANALTGNIAVLIAISFASSAFAGPHAVKASTERSVNNDFFTKDPPQLQTLKELND